MNKTIILGEGCLLDVASRQLIVDGLILTLTPTQYRILEYLVINTGRVVKTTDIIRYVWPTYTILPRDELYVYISRLRRLLRGKAAIISVRGRGYLLERLS